MEQTKAIDWLTHMNSYKTSGMSIKNYCAAHSLDTTSFKNARFRLSYKKSANKTTTSPSAFKEYALGFELRVTFDGDDLVSLRGVSISDLPQILRAVGALSK